jgi:transposase
MDIVHPRVAGIDVHKKVIWVAVRLPGPGPGDRKVIVKSFRTFWRSLLKMTAWLAELGVTDAAMESTGVYWWPVYHALATAGGIEVCVCNAAHMRNVPGRKTAIKDCQWIAGLHEHGLLRPSFIPGQQVAALRARTRYRKKLIEHRTAENQRLAKVLEDEWRSSCGCLMLWTARGSARAGCARVEGRAKGSSVQPLLDRSGRRNTIWARVKSRTCTVAT